MSSPCVIPYSFHSSLPTGSAVWPTAVRHIFVSSCFISIKWLYCGTEMDPSHMQKHICVCFPTVTCVVQKHSYCCMCTVVFMSEYTGFDLWIWIYLSCSAKIAHINFEIKFLYRNNMHFAFHNLLTVGPEHVIIMCKMCIFKAWEHCENKELWLGSCGEWYGFILQNSAQVLLLVPINLLIYCCYLFTTCLIS